MESLQYIIRQKHELLARETFSRRTINYSEDMPADQKDRYIQIISDLRVLEYQIGIKGLPSWMILIDFLHNNRYYRTARYSTIE